MSIAPGQAGSTSYSPAANTETGASMLYVVVNGVASAGTAITVASTCSSSSPTLAVGPTTNFSASGPIGGPFSPASVSYTLSAQTGSLNYAVTNIPSWLTASGATTGTLAAGASATVSFAVNSSANSLGAGAYAQGVTFSNLTNNQGTTTRTAALAVNKTTTSTSVTSSSNPSKRGQTVTFTATISGKSPTGIVTFKDGTKTLGTGSVSNAKATYSTSSLSKGNHSITASYGGDANNAASVSSTLVQQVQ
jgi:hypothetical protein